MGAGEQFGRVRGAIAIDGQVIRDGSKVCVEDRCTLAAALEHGTGQVLGQTQVADGSHEITAVRQLIRELGL